MMRAIWSIVAAAFGIASIAAAPPDPDMILRQAFKNFRATSSQSHVSMTIHRPSWARSLAMDSWTRGDNDALVRFTAPAKDAGNATLKLNSDTWVYNPKLNQVIKLPASMLSQSWMGSDFSYNDLSKSEEIITDYTHRLVGSSQSGGHTVWTIECAPKAGAPVVWGKVLIMIRDDEVITGETFFDQDMKPARQMTVDKIGPLGGRPYPLVMTMHPLDQPGQWTSVQTLSAQFNSNQPAYLFTLSNLRKSEALRVLAALAWRNLWRRPQRTVLSVLSIAILSTLLVFVLSFQQGVYGQMKETTLRILDGYAQFQPPGYADDPTLDRDIADPSGLAARATAIRGVTAAAPRVNGFAILANGSRSYAASVMGVDPSDQTKVSTLPGRLVAGRYLIASDTNAAVLGGALAKNLGVAVGDKVTLLGSAKDGSVAADVLVVRGVYRTGMPELDRSILEMPLARAQDTFGMTGEANTIALAGPSLSALNRALPKLDTLAHNDGVIVRDWGAMEPAMRDTLDLKYATSMVFYATLVLVVAFIILNTLLMSVLERTREYGVLLALGMRSSQIGVMVWAELVIMTAIGAAVGIAIGAALTLWLRHSEIVFQMDPKLLAQFGVPRVLEPELSWASALSGPGALFAAILVGGLVPYLHVRALTPAIAMRAP